MRNFITILSVLAGLRLHNFCKSDTKLYKGQKRENFTKTWFWISAGWGFLTFARKTKTKSRYCSFSLNIKHYLDKRRFSERLNSLQEIRMSKTLRSCALEVPTHIRSLDVRLAFKHPHSLGTKPPRIAPNKMWELVRRVGIPNFLICWRLLVNPQPRIRLTSQRIIKLIGVFVAHSRRRRSFFERRLLIKGEFLVLLICG